jgi:nucleotide sugar dehydrogenase
MKELQNIGIVGQGFVGTAVMEKFRQSFAVYAYDKDPSLSVITSQAPGESTPTNLINIANVVENCNIIFVCVPTPMFEDGECDTRIVEEVIEDIAKEAEFQNKKVIAVIKSTIPPGTTERLNGLSNKVGVVFNPEFLTEANATADFENQTRIVLGIDYMEYIEPISSIFKTTFPEADLILINSKEAEMTKYTTNLFLATKVSFFNDIYSLCEKLEINYDNVIEATMHDPRIGKSHYEVPGNDGDRGFGGHCFPKDLQAILAIAMKFNLGLPTITGTHVTNMMVRKNKDWMDMEGRAVSTRPDPDAKTIEEYPANVEGSYEFNLAITDIDDDIES